MCRTRVLSTVKLLESLGPRSRYSGGRGHPNYPQALAQRNRNRNRNSCLRSNTPKRLAKHMWYSGLVEQKV